MKAVPSRLGGPSFGPVIAISPLSACITLKPEHEALEKEVWELRKKVEQVEQKQAAVLALSTPVIEIWDGVLVLPLIGVMDDERMAQLTERLLTEVKERRAPTSILELTGILTLDAASARHLVRVVDAVSLLGARVVLCGLRPEVAQMLSGLDVDLRTVRVVRSLKEALLGCVRPGSR